MLEHLTCVCGNRWPATRGYRCPNCNREHPAASLRRVDQTDQGAQLVLPGAERHEPPRPVKARPRDARQDSFDL